LLEGESAALIEAPRLRRLRKLTHVSRGLANATSLHEVLSLTVIEAALLLDASQAALLLYDSEGRLQVRATHAVATPLVERSDGEVQPSLESLLATVLGEAFEKDAIAVPLIVSGQVQGALAVIRGDQTIPEEEEEWLLSALADQAMVALEKERLEQIQDGVEHRALLARVGHRLLGQHDVSSLYAEITSSICTTLGVDLVGIFGPLQDGTLELLGGTGWSAPEPPQARPIPEQITWERLAAGSKNPVAFGAMNPSEASRSEAFLRERTVTSGLIVAIEPADKYGVLGLYTRTARQFSREESDVLASLAALLGSALERTAAETKARIAADMRDELLAIVSHDLRNPLSAMIMAASMLSSELRKHNEKGALERYSGVIDRNGRRMAKMLDDLLDFEGIRGAGLTLQSAEHDVGPLLEDIVEMLTAQANAKSIQLTTEVAPGVSGWFDRDRTLQVLSNLVGNAIKFTPASGTITIQVTVLADELLFAVRDSGVGIPPDQLARVFERYWQAKRTDRRGIGLGLSIAQGLVEAQGGTLSVESELGRGTTFSFTLPLYNQPFSSRAPFG
jgi:signal transduction histidine kinase